MKLKNILISFAVILSSLFVTTVKAETAPNSISINGANSYYLEGSNYLGTSSSLRFTYKQTTSGKLVYCTEIHDNWFYSGTRTFTLSSTMNSRIAYIVKNGAHITGNKNKDYFITGLAIWYVISPNDSVFTYFDLNAGTYKGVKSPVVGEIAKLVNNSKNYSYVEPTIKINGNSFTLSSDKKYYVSTMNVKTTGNVGDYTVSLNDAPSGTIVTDTNGNAKNTFDPNANFMVKVPVSSIKELSTKMSVSVKSTGTTYKAYVYKPSDNSIQSVVTGYDEVKNISDSANLKLDITTEVQITKVDATTSKELPGAHLVVKDANGSVKDEWDSTNEAHSIKNILKPGKYTLTETIAPDGYIKSEETIEFEVFADGRVTKVEMKNYPKKDVYISKQDATTGKELPGAHLVLKNSKGKKVYEWDSKTTPHKVEVKLPAGKYTLTETLAPDGYVLNEETVEFTVEKDGSVKEKVVMLNYPNIYISKQDATTGKELPGAHLVLKNSKGEVVDEWDSKTTPHKVEGKLLPGKYTLTETDAPNGYVKSEETVTFTVEKDGSVKEKVVMLNYPEEPKTVYISKRDVTTGEELPGAYLEIKDANGEIVEAWISGDTPHKVEGLAPGVYTLTETIAPDGYELSKETVEFTVREDGTVDGMVIMYNKPEQIEVPSTSSFKTITASLIGLIIMGLGSMMIYKNYKKNEEV